MNEWKSKVEDKTKPEDSVGESSSSNLVVPKKPAAA
jgi:hypothetical protein